MSNDLRFTLTANEMRKLADWLTRMDHKYSMVELRSGNEPGIGPAITAYVETGDDEGYFRMLSAPEEKIKEK